MYTYAPPDDGIAVANSDFEIAAGRMTIPANKNANQIPPTGFEPLPPISTMAKAGMTNKPVPSIEAKEIMTTENNPNFLSRVSTTLSKGLTINPTNSFAVNPFINNPLKLNYYIFIKLSFKFSNYFHFNCNRSR